MSMVIGLVAFDVGLFASRSLLHANPANIGQNLVLLNYVVSLFFFFALNYDIIELLSLNTAFKNEINKKLEGEEEEKEKDADHKNPFMNQESSKDQQN